MYCHTSWLFLTALAMRGISAAPAYSEAIISLKPVVSLYPTIVTCAYAEVASESFIRLGRL